MIDHRIIQQIGVRDNAPALNMFQNVLNQAQNRRIQTAQAERQAALAPFQQQIVEQQAAEGKRQVQQARRGQILQSMNDFAVGNASVIQGAQQTGDSSQLRSAFVQHRQRLIDQDVPTETTDEAIGLIDEGKTGEVISGLGDAVNLFNQAQGKGQFATKSFAPIMDEKTGQMSTPVFDPNTQSMTLVPIEGAISETKEQAAEREHKQAVKQAELEVETTRKKETIKKTAERTSNLKKEFSERRRMAARSKVKIANAKKLADSATQGFAGASMVQFGRVFPGIDVKDEAALSGALKSLALDELQKFKGPTTDFEFRVTEDIAGSLGDGAAANKARLSSLERASWFADRESKQFNDHVKAGHDPDEFFFNFSELVTPKKGGKSYSLQDLQDTAVANHISIDEVIERLSR